MGTTDTASNWEKIRLGVKDAETLIGQKKYNMSMVRCRQTLEYMVRCLADKACLVDTELSVTIDDLYQGRWISKTTCDHYHKIRMIGNKAVHEGNDSAYDANQAYHLLSQEVYTFANDYRVKKPRPSSSSASSSHRARHTSRKGRKNDAFPLSQADMLRILIGALCVIFIIAIVVLIKPKKKKEAETTAPTTVEVSVPDMTTAPETMAPTTPAAVYKTSSVLNVRSEPSTTAEKLGKLPAGTVVDYVGPENDEWAIINYNGQQAYVASQYLVHD